MTTFLVSYIVSIDAANAEEAALQLRPAFNNSKQLDLIVAPLDNASQFQVVTVSNEDAQNGG